MLQALQAHSAGAAWQRTLIGLHQHQRQFHAAVELALHQLQLGALLWWAVEARMGPESQGC